MAPVRNRVLMGLVAAALACVSQLPSARAAPHPIELRWEGPEGCPGASEVAGEIDRLLGGRPAGEGRMVVDAQARGGGNRWTLDMSIRDNAGEGERVLEGASCAELANAAALIVALAFDPEAVAETQRRAAAAGAGVGPAIGADAGPPPEGDPPAAPPPLAGPPAGPADAAVPESPLPAPVPTTPPVSRAPVIAGVPDGYLPPPTTSSKRVWLSAALRPAIDLGTLPAPALGIGGALALRWYPLVARLRGGFFVGVEQTLDSRPSAGGHFDLWVLAPGFCITPWRNARDGRRRAGDLALDLCSELELGQLAGEGFGVKNPDRGSALWLTPMLGAQAELTLQRWVAVRLGLAAGAPFFRPDFVLSQVGIVHAAAPVIGRGGLEVAVVY